MLLNISRILVAASVFMMAETALANPPYVELDSIFYVAAKDQCKDNAMEALRNAGFRTKSASYADEDSVGTAGEYKGVVSCINIDLERVIVIVAGPNYQEVVRKLDNLKAAMKEQPQG